MASVIGVVCALALGVHALTPSQLGAQERTVPRSRLPADLRKVLARGELQTILRPDTLASGAARNTLAAKTTVLATGALSLKSGQLLGGRTDTGTVPVQNVELLRSINEIAARSDTAAPLRAFELPFAFASTGDGGMAVVSFKPVVFSSGLNFVPDSAFFEGTFFIGLRSISGSVAPTPFPQPVRLTVVGDAQRIAPEQVSFTEGDGEMVSVRVWAEAPLDSLRVQVITPLDADGAVAWLPVKRALAFDQPPRSMQGLGFESRTLSLSVRGVSRHDTLTVRLSADHGTLDTYVVRIPPGGGASVRLTSDPLGPLVVRATATGFASAVAPIEAVMPTRYALAALFGGFVGAVFSYLRTSTTRRKAHWFRTVLGSLVGAIISTAVYVGLDLNLLPVTLGRPLGTWLAVFAFSALGGAIGLQLSLLKKQPT